MTNTESTARPVITITKVTPQRFQHTASDRKDATRYAVLVNGVKIGEVGSHSEESWADNGRLRTRKLGYHRSWLGALETNPDKGMVTSTRRADAWHSGRTGCIERLVEAYLEGRK
jgi:hypothetical protein